MKYTLKKPVKLVNKEGGEIQTVSMLEFREDICAGDLRGLKVSSIADLAVDELMKIAGRLCGQPDVTMNKLGNADTFKVMEVVGGFLLAGLETGESA